MKFNKKVISIVALASVITLSGVQAGERAECVHGDRLERMTDKLDLTEQQQVTIASIVSEFKLTNQRPEHEEMKAKFAEKKANLAALMATSEFDEAAVIAHMEEQVSEHHARQLEMLRHQHSIYQQLTEEQQPKYLKMMAKKMRKMKGKHSKHHQHADNDET